MLQFQINSTFSLLSLLFSIQLLYLLTNVVEARLCMNQILLLHVHRLPLFQILHQNRPFLLASGTREVILPLYGH